MANIPENVETSKQLSAQRQIHAAIDHFKKGEFECAMTLAAAAEGQLPETGAEYLFRILRRLGPDLDLNLVINWLKHPFAPDKATISQFEVAITIARAISKFVAAYSLTTHPFEEFSAWAKERGHIPRPLTKKSN